MLSPSFIFDKMTNNWRMIETLRDNGKDRAPANNSEFAIGNKLFFRMREKVIVSCNP